MIQYFTMSKYNSKVQVKKEHYFNEGYDNIFRFLSYFKQIELIREQKPKSILEIGVGNGVVSTYLKQNKYNIRLSNEMQRGKHCKTNDTKQRPPVYHCIYFSFVHHFSTKKS